MKNFTFGGSKFFQGGPEGGRGTRFLKKSSNRTVALTHTENVSILAQLENVQKSGELTCEEKKERRNKS